MFFRRTLSVAGVDDDEVTSTTASVEALAPVPHQRAPARFHYLADQPLEITNSLKGYNYPRSRADAIYKPSPPLANETDRSTRWKTLRWILIGLIALLLLVTTGYTIIWASQSRLKEINNITISSNEEDRLLDLEAHSSLSQLPGKLPNHQWSLGSPQNDIENTEVEENNAESNSTESALAEEVSFVDRLISSFQESAQNQKAHHEGLSVKQFTSLGETGYVRRIPNGHKYGEYQSLPSMSKYLGMSTTSLPVSPTLPILQPRGISQPTKPPFNYSESNCHSPQLPMCRGVIPWDLTSVPTLPGINTMESLRDAMPYFELILDSGCSQRARQFLCSLLEPECQPFGQSLNPPCRRICKAVAEECNDFILDVLDLSKIFKCENYPDADDSCVNLAKGEQCLKKEMTCEDGTCIPKRWKCNGVKDCKSGIDEINCTICNNYQFLCNNKEQCIPRQWRCDGHADCADESDEINCQAEVMVVHSHASPCPAGELRCVDGRCITLQQICDGSKDCSDGADEAKC